MLVAGVLVSAVGGIVSSPTTGTAVTSPNGNGIQVTDTAITSSTQGTGQEFSVAGYEGIGFTAGDDGAGNAALSFFGGTVAAKQTITGALTTVADAPAKAVLTSIIAALVAYGLVTDGTT